ncbi:MAG: sugar MFS transporter [Polyangiaceae bacterium]|jgi:MFS transporter, FHS family, L-fucose permease
MPPTDPSLAPGSDQHRRRVASGVLIALFFAIGFLTCLNDVVLPHLKSVFELDYTRAALVQFSFFAAYFAVSAPAGLLIRRLGYKRAIVVGLGAAAAGCLGFYPAAAWRSYGLFLGALFVLASGFTLLQVAANPYVAVLGSRETASSRLTLTQAFNSVGTTVAPLVGAWLILPSIAATPSASSVQVPYLAFAGILVAFAVTLALLRLPDARPTTDGATKAVGGAWSHGPLVFGAVGIFLYVGAEVSIGSFLVSFLRDPAIGGIDAHGAARSMSLYWGGAMIGRFVGAAALRTWKPRHVLAVFAAFAFALVLTTVASSGHVAMVAILAVGLFNSIMFPTIFTLAIDGLGERTEQGSGILCMAIVGGAILPVLQGAVADRIGLHLAFVVPMASYGYIAWYGLHGSMRRERTTAPSADRRAPRPAVAARKGWLG